MGKRTQTLLTGFGLLAAAVILIWWWPFPGERPLAITPALALMALSFVCGYVDSSLGMGYGSTLTPLLLLLGFAPLEVVPAIVATQLGAGAVGSLAHHYIGNVDLRPGGRAFKVAAVLASTAIAGSAAGVYVAVRIPESYLQTWVGVMVCAIGAVTLILYGRRIAFSWGRIIVLGIVGAFNKGTTGGGYGPLIMGGQILAGVAGKDAVGITTFAETLTCVVAVAGFLMARDHIIWRLTPFLLAGALAAVPFSAFTVAILRSHHIKIAIGVLTIALGLLILLKTYVF